MKKEKIEFKLSGVGNLGTWTTKRYLKIDPAQDVYLTVMHLVDKFPEKNYINSWEVIEWEHPDTTIVERKWFDAEIQKRCRAAADLIKLEL